MITKLQFFIKKISIFFSCEFFSIFCHRNPELDPDPQLEKMPDPGSALNRRGSTTEPWNIQYIYKYNLYVV
jgi:hypothetical protein